MEVTFEIDEKVLERLREEAHRCGETMSSLVESALRMALPAGDTSLHGEAQLAGPSADDPLPPLPTWRAEFLVDISNREELYRVLDDNPKFRDLYGVAPNSAPEEGE